MTDVRRFDEAQYPDRELTGEIIRAFYYVYHCFGYGFLESVYRRAMLVELRFRGIPAASEVPFEVDHRGVVVGTPRIDLLAYGRIIVETKAGAALDPTAAPQLQNYLRAAKLELGLILHFGPKPSVKRLIGPQGQLKEVPPE